MTVRIPFVAPLDEVTYGVAEPVAEGLERILAKNPSRFTYRGTGTYVLGDRDVVVIDPGPDLASHRDALAAAVAGRRVRGIVVTHCHADHSPLAAWLQAETSAPTFAIGPHGAVDSEPEDLPELAPPPAPSGSDTGRTEEPKETVDLAFRPEVTVTDGETFLRGPGWTLTAVHTPGHTSNHLCVAWEEQRALFSGDHVMGWSTTVVSPPDGDMAQYLASLDKVIGRHDEVLWPTHGRPITDPEPFLAAYRAHRLERDAQVLDQVRSGVSDVVTMVRRLYADVDVHLHRAAARSVLAHLVKLVAEGTVAVADGAAPGVRSRYVAV